MADLQIKDLPVRIEDREILRGVDQKRMLAML